MAGEKKIENQIKKLLRDRGAYFIKVHGNAYMKSGIPDILACYRGRFLGIEVKDIGKKPSEQQVIHIDNINIAGGYAFYTDSVGEVERVLDEIDMDYDYDYDDYDYDDWYDYNVVAGS